MSQRGCSGDQALRNGCQMSSHLNIYVGPFVRTSEDSAGGPARQQYEQSHGESLSAQRTGYRETAALCWLPNRPNSLGLIIDRTSDNDVWQITPESITAQLAWFHEAYAAEIATLTRLWSDAEAQFGVVAYYL